MPPQQRLHNGLANARPPDYSTFVREWIHHSPMPADESTLSQERARQHWQRLGQTESLKLDYKLQYPYPVSHSHNTNE